MTRRALGKGLDAIFANLGNEVTNPATGAAVHEIELSRITPNPFQPRHEFAEEELRELAASIEQSGLIQPIFLRRHGQGYQIVSGERRFRAFQSLGLPRIPALVREQVSDRDMRELALVENIQRVQLNVLEEAHAFEELVNACGMTHEEIAGRVGKSRAAVTNTLRLLKLEPAVRDWLREGKLTAGHGRALLQFQGPAQIKRAQAIMDTALNVREAERGHPAQAASKAPALDADTRAFLDELRFLTGMKATLRGGKPDKAGKSAKAHKGSQKGVLELHYMNRDDMNNLIETLRRGRAV
jgi:ParB family chromosome partitioning protein